MIIKVRGQIVIKFRKTVSLQFDTRFLTGVRDAINRELVLGNERFKDEVDVIFRRPVCLVKPDSIRKNKHKYGRQVVKSSDVNLTPKPGISLSSVQ